MRDQALLQILPHLGLPEPHRHVAENARTKHQEPRTARQAFVLGALTRTLAITPEELQVWVLERLGRFKEPEADGPPPQSQAKQLTALNQQITREVSLNEIGKLALNLPGVTALREGGVGAVRAGCNMPLTEAVRDQLAAMQPPAPDGEPETPARPQDQEKARPSSEQVWKSLHSFARRTGLGPSGMPIHAIRSVAQQAGGVYTPSLIALTDFICHLLCRELPHEIMSIWASTKLLALTKANGKPRPIAVGEIFRHIAAKVPWPF